MDGISRYKVDGKIQQLSKNYTRVCLLDHEHTFSVMYDYREDTFTISKEQFFSPEDIKDEWETIFKLLAKENCSFCDSKLQMSELAGFLHDNYNPYDIEKPICNRCWKEHWGAIDNNDHYYCSLKKYLRCVDLLGDEELKSCPALYDYPKTADIFMNKVIPASSTLEPPLSDLDLDLINRFRKEVDIEWHRNPDEGGSAVLEASQEEVKQARETIKNCQHEYNPTFSKGKRCCKCFVRIVNAFIK